jgi:primary-amine oxidase
VRQAHCVPAAPEPFGYAGLQAFGFDGAPRSAQGTEDLRKEAELFHRIKVEL